MANRPLEGVDLTVRLSSEDAAAAVARAQRRLTHLTLTAAGLLDQTDAGPSIIVVFEGFDAAGKGGAIRRVTAALDPRHVRVVPVGPPNDLERAHHFLWRFQQPLPARGSMTVYDRSWYGRLLVERVERLITATEVDRSAAEIVEFERALVADDALIVKFWLHISDAEQLRRFHVRRDDPLKRWKLTDDDWRNRERRSEYVAAANEMIEQTDQEHARWHVVAAEDKHYARAHVLTKLTEAVDHALARRGTTVAPTNDDDYLDDE